MRAINHALTGAIIGLTIGQPAIAVPVAIASHFILDAIPHEGVGNNAKLKLRWVRSKLFRSLLYIDALLCGILVLLLATDHPKHWLLAAVCAFAAAAPDFLSINLYRRTQKNNSVKSLKPTNLYNTFASKIQWFERPIGWVVEVAWFVGAVILLIPLLT